MVTERTTQQIIEENSCIMGGLITTDVLTKDKVWVLKEEVIKTIEDLKWEISRDHVCGKECGLGDRPSMYLSKDIDEHIEIFKSKFNSPPDDVAKSSVPFALDSEEGAVSGLRTSSEEDNNNLRCEKHNLLLQVGGDGSSKFFYCKTCDLEKAYEDYKQEEVIHCPKKV